MVSPAWLGPWFILIACWCLQWQVKHIWKKIADAKECAVRHIEKYYFHICFPRHDFDVCYCIAHCLACWCPRVKWAVCLASAACFTLIIVSISKHSISFWSLSTPSFCQALRKWIITDCHEMRFFCRVRRGMPVFLRLSAINRSAISLVVVAFLSDDYQIWWVIK